MDVEDVVNKFDELDTKWFLDSGSLLGIIREGHLLQHDHDLDIGIIGSVSTSGFETIIPWFLSHNFRIVRFFWGSEMYKCKIVPSRGNDFPYILDCQFYKSIDGNYICPQMIFKNDLSFFENIKKRIIRLKKSDVEFDTDIICIKHFIKRAISFLVVRRDLTMQYKNYAGLFDFYFWRIPCNYLDEVLKYKGFNVFKNAEQYLEYRYGNWKIPAIKWDFTKDDHSIRKASNELISSYEGKL